MKKAFTLIELVIVIAIIAILSTLAVNRIGNVRERAARTVSLSNQIAIGRAVDTFLAMKGEINYLDSLISYGIADDLRDGNGFLQGERMFSGFYNGPEDTTLLDANSGLTPRVTKFQGAPLLQSYSLSKDEVDRLHNRGFKYVMRHFIRESDITSPLNGDDGGVRTITEAEKSALVLDPHRSAAFVRALTNGVCVAAVSPFTKLGRDVYRACGQNLVDRETYANGRYAGAEAEVLKDLNAKGGVLLAFGLGKEASLIGNKDCGLESVPLATYPVKRYYRQYILLFHVDTSTPAGRLDFRGVLDPCGFTVDEARALCDGNHD